MFHITITPRFGEMDVLGHINNISLACWFELARTPPMFGIFQPPLPIKLETWPLILAHTDYDFVGQIHFPQEVEVCTYVEKIGTKSFTLFHEAWQKGQLCATGHAVLVYYNFNAQQSEAIPEEIKQKLREHLKP